MIECQICKKQMKVIGWKHLRIHNLSISEYRELYPNAPIKCEESKKIKSEASKRANASRKGVPRSAEVKLKMSETKKRNKNVAWNKGLPMPEHLKQNLSEKTKLRLSDKTNHWNYGNTTPDSVKQKISKSLIVQNRTYSEESKRKRIQTLEQKKKDGWIHPSSKRKGIPSNLTAISRSKIKEVSKHSNAHKKVQSHNRIIAHVNNFGLKVIGISDDSYLFTLQCKCGCTFTRTQSVLVPSKYDIYKGEYCPECFPCDNGCYSYIYFNNNPHKIDIPGRFYVSLFQRDNEQFIKIGITSRTANLRLLQETVYNHLIVLELDMLLYDAFKLEQHILNMHEKYVPDSIFGGHTECIPFDELNAILYNLNEYLNDNNIKYDVVRSTN